MDDLTGFQRDLLYVIAGGDEPNGLTVRAEIDKYYEREIDRAHVYYNRDVLFEEGYLEHSERVGRGKRLRLTEKGQQSLVERRSWEDDRIELTGEWEEDPEAPAGSMAERTKIERDVIYVVAGGDLMLGADVHRELDAYYPGGVRQNTIYNSLADGVERGDVSKERLDGSHTWYDLSEQGRRTLEARRSWESQYVEV